MVVVACKLSHVFHAFFPFVGDGHGAGFGSFFALLYKVAGTDGVVADAPVGGVGIGDDAVFFFSVGGGDGEEFGAVVAKAIVGGVKDDPVTGGEVEVYALGGGSESVEEKVAFFFGNANSVFVDFEDEVFCDYDEALVVGAGEFESSYEGNFSFFVC